MTLEKKLVIYESLLIKWQNSINLVSHNTIKNIESRHFDDSKQIFELIKNKNINIVDLGSGAGFPGMVLAIMGCSNVSLIESDQKKSIFLKNVSRETKTPVTILNQRIETVTKKFDIITARALATINQILEWSESLIKENTQFILLKSEAAKQELTAAKQNWYFEAEFKASKTDPDGQIIILSKVQRLKHDR